MEQECRVVFLDRDGVINKRPPIHEYVSCRDELHILPGVAAAIRRCNNAGLLVFVVSNQRDIARGIVKRETVDDVHVYLNELLGKEGAHIDGFYVCPHGLNECNCRKPAPGLLIRAEQDLLKKGYIIDKSHSVMIGDSDSDIGAGKAYGVRSIKIGDEGAADLGAAIDEAWSTLLQ